MNAIGVQGVDTARTVNPDILRNIACPHGATQAHGYVDNSGHFVRTHYHIRFVGSNENAPGC